MPSKLPHNPRKKGGITPSLQRILEGRHHDPFNVLGRHPAGEDVVVRVFRPAVAEVILENGQSLQRLGNSDLFEWRGKAAEIPERYQLSFRLGDGHVFSYFDPYCFPPQIADFDLHLFAEGSHWHAYRFLGAHLHCCDGIEGVLFATWAPNAERVSVIGNFNNWDGRIHPMRARGATGVWELFLPGLCPGDHYKFEIRSSRGGDILEKTDPYGNYFELRPKTAAMVAETPRHRWQDDTWIADRAGDDWLRRPMSIYELHFGSWRLEADGGYLNYRELAKQLIPYVCGLGFTHIELLPITEHPLDDSWGYQTTGYYAPSSRFGTPDDFRFFIDQCHCAGLGVILDWAPAHFPKDSHALAQYDGSALYEHEDPRLGEHRDWGTLIFNYGRKEVKNFLLSSAIYWLEEFHIDGLRVDAVASMIYLDYSREPGDWLPNRYGGNENLEAIDFLRELNSVTHEQHPGSVMIAEESTAWPQVTRPTWLGGLGFSMKWNMGWMHDSLAYLQNEPVHRSYHHDHLTFGLLYAFTENFVLPFSHDEVVHGKGSMLTKMPGDEWQRLANLRLLYTYMWTYPGKKLLFMGSEFGQWKEWNQAEELDWALTSHPGHAGLQAMIADLNGLYRGRTSLHARDFDANGFEWIDCHDASQSIVSWLRRSEDEFSVVVLNFTPVPRHGYRIGVPESGTYREVFNSDSAYYGGSEVGNGGLLGTDGIPWMGHPDSLLMSLPPLGGLVLTLDPNKG